MQYDENLIIKPYTENGVTFYDAKSLSVYGVYYSKEEKTYRRLDKDVALKTSPGVDWLAYHTAGGRVRFKTNSRRIDISCKFKYLTNFAHMPLSGTSGFSLFADCDDGKSIFLHTYIPSKELKDGKYVSENGFSSSFTVPIEVKADCFTLYMPSYNPVDELYIGVDEGKTIEKGKDYSLSNVIFYGSSITQGACASHPDMAYECILSRKFDFDFINLGFSGNAKGERIMANYIASLHPSVFVLDYDHNAPSVEHLENTHLAFYKTFREQNPTTPVIIMTAPVINESYGMNARFNAIEKTYLYAKEKGENVYLVDGRKMFDGDESSCCTVEGCHPTDLGFMRMATSLYPAFEDILKK